MTTATEPLPNPGSLEAQKRGCLCPVMDNRRGLGAYMDANGKPVFWQVVSCPLHGHPLVDRLLEAVGASQ